jgi:hypothetical protein
MHLIVVSLFPRNIMSRFTLRGRMPQAIGREASLSRATKGPSVFERRMFRDTVTPKRPQRPPLSRPTLALDDAPESRAAVTVCQVESERFSLKRSPM